jgi:hypothetical protein
MLADDDTVSDDRVFADDYAARGRCMLADGYVAVGVIAYSDLIG